MISYFLRGVGIWGGVLLLKGGVPFTIWVKNEISILIKKISPAALKGLLYFCFDDENCKIIACGAILSTFSTVNQSLPGKVYDRVRVRVSIRLNLFRCMIIRTSRPLFKTAYCTCPIYKKTSFSLRTFILKLKACK